MDDPRDNPWNNPWVQDGAAMMDDMLDPQKMMEEAAALDDMELEFGDFDRFAGMEAAEQAEKEQAAAAAAPDEAPPRPAKALSRAGTTPPRVPRYWPQRTGNSDIADGQTGRSAALKATTPCAKPIKPIPAISSRDRMASPAAMPESAHGPHCTLAARKPVSRRRPPSESRQQFAAA